MKNTPRSYIVVGSNGSKAAPSTLVEARETCDTLNKQAVEEAKDSKRPAVTYSVKEYLVE
jgi:hypothetical protein